MGRRKRKTWDSLGGRATASSNKPEPSIRDLKLEALEDLDQFQTGDLVEIPLDGDPLIEEAEDPHQLEIISSSGSNERLQDRSVFLVACHWDWSESSEPYPVYKVDLAHSRVKRKRLRRAGRMATVAGGKTFTSVRHRASIVGVGDDPSHTVIFDTKEKKVIHGPNPKSAKWCPVLMPVGDKVYAMAKNPSWIADPNFPPWFEVLDLSGAIVVTINGRSHLEGCSWSDLPHPPCFPWKIRPLDYRMLPVVVVMSYVVVSTYILVSFNQDWGTYAFDTSSCEWHKVDDNRLPFIGCATPLLGSTIFLGLCKKNDGPISAYCIHVATCDRGHALKLSITELSLKYMGHEVAPAGPCFSSLDGGRFCSLSFSLDGNSVTLHHKKNELYPKTAHVNLTTYQIENPSSLLEDAADVQALKQEIAISTQKEQPSRFLVPMGSGPHHWRFYPYK